VKIASAERASTPVNVPIRTLGAAGVPPLGGAASELSAFVSLVTGFREIPADPNVLGKATKNHKKEELSDIPPQPCPLSESMTFLTRPPAAREFSALKAGLPVVSTPVTSDENRNDSGSVQRAVFTPNLLVDSVPALTRLGDLAFTLRLTPKHSETVNAPPVVIPATPPRATNSTSDIGPKPVQTESGGLDESIANSDQLRVASPAASAATTAAGEQILTLGLISSLVPTPKNPEDASARLGPLQARSSAEGIVTASPRDSRVTSGPHLPSEPQLKSEARGVAANGDSGLTRGNPDGQSGASHPEPKEPKTEAAVKQESQGFPLSDNHPRESGITLAVPGWPSDAAGAGDAHAPDTRSGSEPPVNSTALKVAPEPDFRTGVASPITRQISLNLSTDDSTQVNIGFTERAGKVLVAVRTPDHELAQSLRTDLSDLVGRLESKGFKTETWTPSLARQECVPVRSSNSNSGSNQAQHSGPGNGSGQQRQRQNGSTQRQKARWSAQLKETTSANEPRSES